MSNEVTIESLQAELDDVRKALSKANKEAQKHREARGAAQTQVISLAVKDALREKGVDAERLSKLIDVNSLTMGEDGAVSGLDEAMTALEESLPEVFDPKHSAPPVDAGSKSPVDTGMRTGDRLAALLKG